jgi:hypothetical protein
MSKREPPGTPSPREIHAEAARVRARTRAAKREFDAAHQKGMAALKRRDYRALGEAIAKEREVIESVARTRLKPPMAGQTRKK